jgi:hypothetical protein
MKRFASPSECSTAFLRSQPVRPMTFGNAQPPAELPVVGRIHRAKGRFLVSRQLDVAYPQTHRRLRDTDTASYLVDRKSVFASKLSREFSLLCFHHRQQ